MAGHILQASAQNPGGCPSNCITCNGTICLSCTGRYTLYNGSCEACGANCLLCSHGQPCTVCDSKFGPTSSSPWDCRACINNCQVCQRNLTYCDNCIDGYGTFSGNRTCGPCSDFCTTKNTCFKNGAGTCDQCDNGYYFTPTNSCGLVTTTRTLIGNTTSGLTPPTGSNTFGLTQPTGSNTPGMTPPTGSTISGGNGGSGGYGSKTGSGGSPAWTTLTGTLPLATSYFEGVPCPILEVGLGIGIPSAFIITVLVIIIIILYVENRSLRNGKKETEDSQQVSTANAQRSLTPYQQLKTENPQREYDRIDQYDRISTAETVTTGHYETALN